MSITSILRPRVLVALALALILSASAYGFAAANTLTTTNAGSGEGTISGYKTSAITYTFGATNPDEITKVSFTLKNNDNSDALATTTVVATLTDTTPLIYTCTPATGGVPSWDCTPSGTKATAAGLTKLSILAHD